MSAEAPLGVYVHWPYCARICPYCDFNVYKNKEVDEAAWMKALTRDLAYWAEHTKGRKLASLYFGGGTPSLAPISIIESVIETCGQLWGFDSDSEITLEANPTDAEQSRFHDIAATGVNRLSLGVQSLRDDALRFLGRDHNAASAISAITLAQEKFDRVSFDLIYARLDQSLDAWGAELKEALSFGVTHLSLYQLTIEPGTAFEKQVRAKRWVPADEDLCADQFNLAQELTHAAGLPAYEISNHAAPGAQSRHNLIYWRYQDYIGVGPGAHGRLTVNGERIATEMTARPENYLNATRAGARLIEPLSAEAQLIERMTMGLRLREGVTLYADDSFYQNEARAEKLQHAINDGLLDLQCGRLTATPNGRVVLNRLLYELLG
ncbi:MAG: radical SAM family heme chaperone HemW [Pseudomonadota bacterium]